MDANSQSTSGSRLARAIFWIIKVVLGALVLLILLVVLGGGGYLVVNEFLNVSAQVESNESWIAFLRQNMEEDSSQRQQIESLRNEVGDLETRLTTLQTEIAADLERQDETLAALQQNITSAMNDSESTSADTAALAEALMALQQDINENSIYLDNLGGEVDGLQAELDSLNRGVAALQETAVTQAATEMEDIQETLALFQVWVLVSRARLSLAEDDIETATADTQLALRALDAILAASPTARSSSLPLARVRLDTALSTLELDPDLAAEDLEDSWEELDKVIAARILPIEDTAVTQTPAAYP